MMAYHLIEAQQPLSCRMYPSPRQGLDNSSLKWVGVVCVHTSCKPLPKYL